MILLIDVSNLFLRSYAAFPSTISAGDHIGEPGGGIIGSIKTINKLVRDLMPDKVLLCFESGGSKKRRGLYEDYKKGRKPVKVNRFYGDDIPNTDENINWQMVSLVKLLQHTPLKQLYVTDVEADDVIAYLCKGKFRTEDKIIASSDKDFYQLLDTKTKIYSLHKKIILTKEDVSKEFNISAANFALAKCIAGDTSDHIAGIKGLGFKKISKHFPILMQEEPVLLKDLLSYAAARTQEHKAFKDVWDGREILERNWKLIYLSDTSLNMTQINTLENLLENQTKKGNKLEFVREAQRVGALDFDIDNFFSTMNILNNE
jgi:5'-3' exonuclease